MGPHATAYHGPQSPSKPLRPRIFGKCFIISLCDPLCQMRKYGHFEAFFEISPPQLGYQKPRVKRVVCTSPKKGILQASVSRRTEIYCACNCSTARKRAISGLIETFCYWRHLISSSLRSMLEAKAFLSSPAELVVLFANRREAVLKHRLLFLR